MKCKKCKYFVFSVTLGSPSVPVYHCRDGFSPSASCFDDCVYNDKCKAIYLNEFPEARQLTINFKF